MSSGRAVAGWLWRGYMRPYRLALAGAVALMVLEGAMLGALSWLIRPMFDDVFTAGRRDAVIWVGLAIAAVFVTRALAAFGHKVLSVWIGQRVSAHLQRDMLAHMLRLDSAWFQTNPPGALIERMRGDSVQVTNIWDVVLATLARDAVSLIALLGVAVSIDWLWTLIAIAAAPLLMLPIGWLQRGVRRTTTRARDLAGHISTRLDEAFHGVNTIKLTGTEAREEQRIGEEIDGYARAYLGAQTGQAGIVALIDVVAAIGFFGVLTYGGFQIIAGEKSVGEFMSFFTALALLFEPLRRLGNVSGAWAAALASLERLHAIFEARPTILSPARPANLPEDAGSADLVFRDVNFAYGSEPVLRGLSFTAKAGQTTALVGPSGAGKTTVFHLLTRLADVQSGSVSVGGIEVSDLALADLRRLFSVVSQETLLFDESLRDNVVMGEREVEPQALDHALEAAHVSDFLPRTPHGLDSPAGPRGSNLSGGQRQRVAIARAILRNAPLLLLDEATSALDAQSEKLVQGALERLARNRTTLVIAHRLATIREADKIVVMQAGRVVDEGSHDALIARGGLYGELYRLQFSDGDAG